MNSRTSGVIIAVSAAVAGSLIPSTVRAYLDNLYIIALGLGAIVALNAGIALLHILDRPKSAASEAENKGLPRRTETPAPAPRQVLAASGASASTKRSRIAAVDSQSETETATPAQPQQ